MNDPEIVLPVTRVNTTMVNMARVIDVRRRLRKG
jgi:hypothetical protein